MPYLSSGSFMGLGVETTRGTPVAPTLWLPIKTPQVSPMVSWLLDESMRGSPVAEYGNVAGIRHDEYDAKGDVFLDTFPGLLRAFLGSTDTLTTAPASTTLSAAAVAGATTVSTATSVAAGSFISIGSAANQNLETHKVASVTGAGPYTVTLQFPLQYAQASGAPVTGLTGHAIGLLNASSTGSQPPSYTIVDFDGAVARQLADSQGDSLSLSFASDASLAWTGKFLSFPFTNIATPTTESFSSTLFVPGYSCTVAIGGVVSTVVISGDIDITRSTETIITANNGLQTPYRIFAGPIKVTGKLSFVVESGDTTMTLGTTSAKQVVDLIFTDPNSGDQMIVQMSQVQLKNPKINRGKAYVQVDTEFDAESNATDAISTGYSPIRTYVGNQQAAAY